MTDSRLGKMQYESGMSRCAGKEGSAQRIMGTCQKVTGGTSNSKMWENMSIK